MNTGAENLVCCKHCRRGCGSESRPCYKNVEPLNFKRIWKIRICLYVVSIAEQFDGLDAVLRLVMGVSFSLTIVIRKSDDILMIFSRSTMSAG